MINIFQPSLGEDELALVKDVFDSNWIGKGEQVNRFEELFAQNLVVGREHVLSTNSCTEAIFLAGDLFVFGADDEIIIPSISFPSVASCVEKSGATVIFCDVDPRTLNVRAQDIEPLITSKTKAVFVTHYGGISCDMDPIITLCEAHNILIIEDSACAVKSFYKGRACGTMGDMGMWSLDAMKTLTTGDGGMIYLKSLDKVIEAKEFLYLGLPVKQKSGVDSSTEGSRNWWEFDMNRPGRRAIMNNIAGAIGIAQIAKLDGYLARRKAIYDRYAMELVDCELLQLPPAFEAQSSSSYYFFHIQSKHRTELARYLLDKGIYSTFRYWPLHRVNYFERFVTGTLPNSDFAADNTLNIPLHHSLSDEDVSLIISTIKSFTPRN